MSTETTPAPSDRPLVLTPLLANLPDLLTAINNVHADPRQAEIATGSIRRLLSVEREPPIQAVIDAGFPPLLVGLLDPEFDLYPALQFEASWALTNIASGSSEQTMVVVVCGALDPFIRLLDSPNRDLVEQCTWALGNIAGDSPATRDLVLHGGVLPKICNLLVSTTHVSLMRNATWSLSNLCRGKPKPSFDYVAPAIPTLARLLYSTDDEILTDATWALSYISDGPNEHIQAVVDSGITRRVVELMAHHSKSVIVPALRVIGNIVTGDEMQTQAVLNCAALPMIGLLLARSEKGIRKEACWTLSNITAGNVMQIQAVIDSGLMTRLAEIAFDPRGLPEVRKEALFAISNATSVGKPHIMRQFVTAEVIAGLVHLLPHLNHLIITFLRKNRAHYFSIVPADILGMVSSYLLCNMVSAVSPADIEIRANHTITRIIIEGLVNIFEHYTDVECDRREVESTIEYLQCGLQVNVTTPAQAEACTNVIDMASKILTSLGNPRGVPAGALLFPGLYEAPVAVARARKIKIDQPTGSDAPLVPPAEGEQPADDDGDDEDGEGGDAGGASPMEM